MKSLVSGNERVLKARFSDAIFFLNEDKKKTFQERLKLLNGIVFYENIGITQKGSFNKDFSNFLQSRSISFSKYLCTIFSLNSFLFEYLISLFLS